MLGGLHPNGYHKDNANNAVYSSDGIKIGEKLRREADANIWYKRGNTNYRLRRYDEGPRVTHYHYMFVDVIKITSDGCGF
jgi:hypothetical protein